METRIAQSISWLFHPLFMPLLSMFILFHTNSYISFAIPFENQKTIYGVFFINTCLLPLVITFLLYRKGYIQNIYLTERKDRYMPLLVAGVSIYITYYLLKQGNIPRIIYSFTFALFVTTFFLFVLNLWWKISIHCTAIAGLLGMVASMSLRFAVNLNLYMMIIIFIAGLIGYSRLRLSSHRPFEIYSGYVIGFFTVWFVVSWGMG